MHTLCDSMISKCIFFLYPSIFLNKQTKMQISMDNWMLLIYSKGLAIVANDSSSTRATETGGLINHTTIAYCVDTPYLNTVPKLSTCTFFSLLFFCPKIIQIKSGSTSYYSTHVTGLYRVTQGHTGTHRGNTHTS